MTMHAPHLTSNTTQAEYVNGRIMAATRALEAAEETPHPVAEASQVEFTTVYNMSLPHMRAQTRTGHDDLRRQDRV